MKPFQAIRYLNKQEVRAVYDDEALSWWYSAMDLVKALTGSNNSRRYWNTFKVRHFYNYYLYKKLKVRSNDLKEYDSDVLNEEGIALLIKLLPKIHILNYEDVVKEVHISFDKFIYNRCKHIYDGLMIDYNIINSTKALTMIQNYLYDSLNNKEGTFRNPLAFDDYLFIKEILISIDYMNNKKIEDFINKFIELNLLKPFIKGNLISGLIWLDLMIRNKFKKCINFNDINKTNLINAIDISYKDPTDLYNIIKDNLSTEIKDLRLRNKNIKYVLDIGNYQ